VVRPALLFALGAARIRIVGGTPAERRTFRTSLYHAYLMPTLVSDRDGRWVGPDGVIRTTSTVQFSDFSLWDTYRTVHPLYDLVDP
jgi:putative alpha-1,2-mannosidase